jgi:hypothetical protein
MLHCRHKLGWFIVATLFVLFLPKAATAGYSATQTAYDATMDRTLNDLDRQWARERACDDALKDGRFNDVVVMCQSVVEDRLREIADAKTWLARHDARGFHEHWVPRHKQLVSDELWAAKRSVDVATGLLATNYRTESRRRLALARDLLAQVHREDLPTALDRAVYAKVRLQISQVASAM